MLLEPDDESKLPRRRQATLYLQNQPATKIEAIRLRYNEVQFYLIRAHVTLCREDEVHDWSELEERLSILSHISVTLCFGELVRAGDLVYLPAVGSNSAFHHLRNLLLATGEKQPRLHQPHLTLVHPRNGKCSDESFSEIQALYQPFSAEFNCVTLIEQSGVGPWRDLAEFR